MGIRSWLDERGTKREVSRLQTEVAVREVSVEYLHERIAELELAADDEGWRRLGFEGEREFTRFGLDRIIKMARIMYLKNPLIRRAISVQTYYVWGQGVSITGPTEGVNEVFQAWSEDHGNRASLTGHQAQNQREVDLQTDGNVFLALFTKSGDDGRVQVRVINVDEIRDIVTNPDDSVEPWFYLREWTQREWDPQTGKDLPVTKRAYYPDWRYKPEGGLPASFGGEVVEGDIPLMHVKVGGLGSMRFGVPDVYAALDWARAYKDFLTNWATIAKALARFAWKLTGQGKALSDAKTKLATTVGTDGQETNPPPLPGSVATVPAGMDLAPIPKTGAQLSAEDGRQLRLMVAAGTDIPDTILAGDPDMGNLATAKTLDRPTELAMKDRQTLWADVYRDIARFVLEQAVAAPNHPLEGKVEERNGRPVILIKGEPDEKGKVEDVEAKVDVVFPPILEDDVQAVVEAIVAGATLKGNPVAGTIPTHALARMILSALGEQDVDARLEELKTESEEEQARKDQMAKDIAAGKGPPPPPPGGEEPVPPAEEREALQLEVLRDLRLELRKLKNG